MRHQGAFTSLSKRAAAVLAAAAILSPGPAWAQSVVSSPVPIPSGITGAAGSVPLSPVPTALPSAPMPGVLAPALMPQASVIGPSLALPSQAISTGRLAASDAARPMSRGLALVSQALSGARQAAAALPIIGHLAMPARGPDAQAGADEQRFQADAQFDAKLGFDSQDAKPIDYEPRTPVPGRVKFSGGKDGGDGDVPDPKYPARNVKFNGAVLPSVAMRPDRPIEPLIVAAIDAAKKSISIAAYEFKAREILKALRRARERGVEVHIVLDYENSFPRKRDDSKYRPHRSLEIQSLINEGFDVSILHGLWKYGIQHNKFMVFDGKLAEFGSYNYSWTAEGHHFENARFTDDAKHVQGFAEYWKYLRGLSVPFAEAREHAWPTQAPVPPHDEKLSIEFNGKRLPKFFFNPDPRSEDWVVEAIDAAKDTVDVSAFTLRSTKIAEALLRAKGRGAAVRVILDKSQNDSDTVRPYRDWLAFHKIKVRVLAGPDPEGPDWAQKNHNKMIILDGTLVEAGSMNFTKNAAIFNFENGSFTTDKTDAAAYQAFFNDLWKNKTGHAAEAVASEPKLPTDQELIDELKIETPPPPAGPVWPDLPAARQIAFNGDTFPAYAVRPQHPVQDLIAQAIGTARKSIRLAIYEFTLPEVLDALRGAKKRGVDIEIVMDYGHVYPSGNDHTGKLRQRSPEIQALMDDGFDIRVVKGLRSSGSMHNKFAIFDGALMAAGSYNWARTAEQHHFENLFFDDDAKRIAFYQKYFKYIHDVAVPAAEGKSTDWKQHRPGPAPVDDDLALEFNGKRFPRAAVSPGGHVEEALLRAIGAAKASIDVAMFSFYSRPLAEALLAAKERGVKVRLALDEGQAKLMKLDEWFAYNGFDLRIVAGPNDDGNVMFEKQHNKFMVVDGRLLETGSFNYTPNAENNNFDNANFFLDDPMVAAYSAFFNVIFDWGWEPRRPTKPPLMKTEDYFEKLAKRAEGSSSGRIE